ncbi:MAG: hypothetical protein FWH27_02950 [Planctomycetaceae bacterium]|nr:hypothetical protein [Planctomycetaceae bacterium]
MNFALTSCLTFLRNNAHLMEYKRFRDNGWPIGSGPVIVPPAQQKVVCKNIVKHCGSHCSLFANVP